MGWPSGWPVNILGGRATSGHPLATCLKSQQTMSPDLNALNSGRGTAKGQIKRFLSFVISFTNNGDVNKLKIRREKVEDSCEEF